MNKLLKLSSLVCCFFIAQYGYAQEYTDSSIPGSGIVSEGTGMVSRGLGFQGQDGYAASFADNGTTEQACCPPDQRLNDCICLHVRYKPCYYTTTRCVEDRIPCTRTCCRRVPKYYEVQRCRMVPQYYSETCCNYCNEYYTVPDCKICKRTVCDRHCKYVPQYYWKRECGEAAPACCPAPAQNCCPSPCGPQGCCPR